MGWNNSIVPKLARTAAALVLAAGLVTAAPKGHAQTFGTGANLYAELQNTYLHMGVGSGTAVPGSIIIQTAPGNPTNPTAGTPVTVLFGSTVETTNNATVSEGSLFYIRVDGGRSSGGNDYIFGRATEGQWITAPVTVGDQIQARWQTLPATVNGNTIDPRIEVDLVASFVHDQARFQITVKNNSPGQTHTVGIAFLQDIVLGKEDEELEGRSAFRTDPTCARRRCCRATRYRLIGTLSYWAPSPRVQTFRAARRCAAFWRPVIPAKSADAPHALGLRRSEEAERRRKPGRQPALYRPGFRLYLELHAGSVCEPSERSGG